MVTHRGDRRIPGHVVRLAILFAIAVVVLLVVRTRFVPASFGVDGHYRADVVPEIAAQPIRYAGLRACAECHDDVDETKSGGGHAGVRCEACHGPMAGHANDPGEVEVERPEPDSLCLVCHRQNVAKPETFPQVDAEEHDISVLW